MTLVLVVASMIFWRLAVARRRSVVRALVAFVAVMVRSVLAHVGDNPREAVMGNPTVEGGRRQNMRTRGMSVILETEESSAHATRDDLDNAGQEGPRDRVLRAGREPDPERRSQSVYRDVIGGFIAQGAETMQ